MSPDEARTLFLEHCEPGDLSHYGEKAAVAAIVAATAAPTPTDHLREEALLIARRLMVKYFGPGKSSAVPAAWVIDAMVELAVAEKSERHSDDALLWALTETCPNEVAA